MGLIFLVMALDLTATGMGFFGKAFGEGTYFYWNIESSRIWPSPSRTDEGSVLTEVPDVGGPVASEVPVRASRLAGHAGRETEEASRRKDGGFSSPVADGTGDDRIHVERLFGVR